MAHIYYANKASVAADYFHFVWWQTRLMLKAGWLHVASSNASALWDTNGTPASRVPTADPATNKWGVPTAIAGQAGAVASIGAASGKDYLITGVTGLVSPTRANKGGSEGNILTLSGAASGANNTKWQIAKVVSSTSCYARPLGAGGTVRGFGYVAGVANDANNGAISWTESTYLDTTPYSAYATGAWMLLQGPTQLKIAFTAAPTGSFLRGENVVQATTGAEGELLGITYEPTTGAGFLVIAPRHMGSDGTGAEGWSNSDAIVGANTAASVTPSAYPVRYLQQMVIFKGATTSPSGTVYFQCVNPVGEAASDFQTLTKTAGCTTVIAPGAGGTGNGFPTIAFCATGTAGSVAHYGMAFCGTVSTNTTLGNGQFFVANCIACQTQSQDGTAFGLYGQPAIGASSSGTPLPILMRCDNGDDGDVDPFVVMGATQVGAYNYGATLKPRLGGNMNGTSNADFMASQIIIMNGNGGWQGWRNRGLASGDAYRDYWTALPYFPVASVCVIVNTANISDPERVSATAQAAAPLVLQPIEIANAYNTTKQRKGTLRWLFTGNGFNAFDTFSAKEWMQTCAFAVNSINVLPLFMPYDGTTTPVQ